MNGITLKKGNIKYSFAVENIKYILGTGVHKYNFLQIFRQYQSKVKSEYRDNNFCAEILFNDNPVDIKRNLFIEVNGDYSITEDSKLGTKSLLLKYYEAKLRSNDLLDTITTLNVILDALEEEINNDFTLETHFKSLNNKGLIKLMVPSYFDVYQKDEFDLNYFELLQFQIELVDYIAKHNCYYEHIIVVMDLLEVPQFLIDRIRKMNNCIFFIFADNFVECMRFDEICLEESGLIYDMADIEQVYQLASTQFNGLCTLEEAIRMLFEKIKVRYAKKTNDFINKIFR